MGVRVWRCLVLAVLLGVALAPAARPAPAAAESCDTEEPALLLTESQPAAVGVAVDITSPRPGARLSGVTHVVGTARSSVPLSRVELRVAGAVLTSRDVAPTRLVEFDLSWDARKAKVGSNTLEVRVCGGPARGGAAVSVTVPPRRPIWFGLVVGTSGVAGLALAFAFRPGAPVSRARRAVRPRSRPAGGGGTPAA